MTVMSGLGIVLSLVFGCLLLALVAELYYLLWWKKQRIISNSSNRRIGEDFSSHAKEIFYLFCWDKPSTIINNSNSNNNTTATNPETNQNDPDVEMGFDARKDLLLKALGEEGVDSDIMKLAGHPRFLFTIKEETKEDLESDDGKSKCGGDKSKKGSRTRSLSDLIMAMETQTQTPYLSPMASPNHLKLLASNNYNNPLFESSVEAEIYRLKSSPPPKFKFLRDAEEKLYRKLLDEAQRSGMLNEVVLGNSHHEDDEKEDEDEDEKDESLMKIAGFNGGKNKEKEWCSSQVLPLASSPSSGESKQLCLH